MSTFGIGPAGGDWGGALADLLRVPYADHMLVPLPPDVPPARAASAADNVAFGYFAVVRQLAARPGAAVLVLGGGGGGSIPLYATALALAHGAERVDLYDRDVRRLEIASRLGATSHEIDEWPEQLGSYPIVVEYTRVGGHPVASEFRQRAAGLACALRSTAPDGHCTSVSIFFGGQAPVPITEMYMKGITFQTGRVHSRTVLPDVLELIASRRIDPDLVTTETARWEDADEALLAYTTKLVLARE